MRFIDLEIAGFGKLVNKKITFDENLTVIYGLNEAGKSTVHACIRAMLFGMPRARGAAAAHDEFSRFKPWKTRKYGAKLRFEDAGHVFTLTRDFSLDPVGCTLYDETDGCEVEEPAIILEYALCSMTRKTFENTVSIGQLKTSTDPGMAEELDKYLVNLNTAGDQALSTQKAADYLKEQKEKLRGELSPEAARTFAANTAEIKKLEEGLSGIPTVDTDKIKSELNDVSGKLQENSEKRTRLAGETAANEGIRAYIKKLTRIANLVLIPAGVLFALTIILGIVGGESATLQKIAILAGLLFGLCLVIEIIFRIIILTQSKQIKEDEEDELTILDAEAEELSVKTRELSEALTTDELSHDSTTEMINRLNELRNKNAHLQEVMAENDRISADMEAIDLALSTMDELSGTMSRSFGHHLNVEASKYISELTDGAYSSLCVDDELHAMLNSEGRMIPMEQLSAGTKEQVYLAVRLAVSKLMQGDIGKLRPLPIIFDDSFVNYDDARLAAAVRWIASSYQGQIIIFSCQFREMDILDEMEVPHINIKL